MEIRDVPVQRAAPLDRSTALKGKLYLGGMGAVTGATLGAFGAMGIGGLAFTAAVPAIVAGAVITPVLLLAGIDLLPEALKASAKAFDAMAAKLGFQPQPAATGAWKPK